MRLRFAPSPTGFLHIGSARTFIYNWIHARKHNGTMILRIDDTDAGRNSAASIVSIFESLKWLGLPWDEEHHQSDRLHIHAEAAKAVLEKGFAYRDFTLAGGEEAAQSAATGRTWLFNRGMRELSREESDRRAQTEPFVLRFRVPRDTRTDVAFDDRVYGPQRKETSDIEDFALLRSDGTPTYHLASCVDDIDLRIDSIVRGQDHLTNTFKHVLLFEALGDRTPDFAHLPLLVAPDGAKLSKRRHGPAVSVTTYRDDGFLPAGFINFISLLGWSPKNNQEILCLDELISLFSLENVHRSSAVVNFTEADPIDPKALWLNGQHIRTMPIERLAPEVRARLASCGIDGNSLPVGFNATVDVLRARAFLLNDFTTRFRAYFADDFEMTSEAREALEKPGARDLIRELATRLESASDFNQQSVEQIVRALAAERGVKAGVLIHASRAALSGQMVGPGAFAIFPMVGRERAIRRLATA